MCVCVRVCACVCLCVCIFVRLFLCLFSYFFVFDLSGFSSRIFLLSSFVSFNCCCSFGFCLVFIRLFVCFCVDCPYLRDNSRLERGRVIHVTTALGHGPPRLVRPQQALSVPKPVAPLQLGEVIEVVVAVDVGVDVARQVGFGLPGGNGGVDEHGVVDTLDPPRVVVQARNGAPAAMGK